MICRDSFNLSHGTFLYFFCNENMDIKCGGQSYSVPKWVGLFNIGSGIGRNTGFRSGRSVEIYDRVFPGISFIFGYFRVFRVFPGMLGIFGYIWVYPYILGLFFNINEG